MIPLTTWPRFLSAIVCLLGTALTLHFRGTEELVVPHADLKYFPREFKGWTGTDIELTREETATLGAGQFLLRDYSKPGNPAVTLFVAYYPSQQAGDTMHSPKNCMPGSGWTPTLSSVVTIRADNGMPIQSNRYVLEQGKDQLVVFYWYQAHGHTEASEYWGKWLLIRDAIRLNRTDGALVRILTSVEEGETQADAERRALKFAQQVTPFLDPYIPR